MNDELSMPVLLVWDATVLLFFGIGVWILRTPAAKLLLLDQRTGRWLYERELKKSGDEQLAVAKAGKFYHILGIVFIAISSVHLLVVSALIARKLLALAA